MWRRKKEKLLSIPSNKLSILSHKLSILSNKLSIISNRLVDLLTKTRPSNKKLLFLVHAPGVVSLVLLVIRLPYRWGEGV